VSTTIDGTPLFAKIHGGLLGAAVGDALGGPVEGLDYTEIEQRHGRVETMLPYTTAPSEHNHFRDEPGSVTDDTRVSMLHCEAIFASRGDVARGDLARVMTDYHYAHPGRLQRAFIEEYHLKGFYGARKLLYGGHPTNGAIMGNTPLGLLHPADPRSAFEVAFELAYITDGYAKESAAIAAASIAVAMRPGATVTDLIDEALDTAVWHRREGPLWGETIASFPWAAFEGRTNQRLVADAVEIAERHRDVFAVRDEMYAALKVSPLGSEAGQTLSVALGMLVAAGGDYRETVIGAVNYGRDNDSYAAVAGGIAGALHGVEAIPEDWRAAVVSANPEYDFEGTARRLTELVVDRHHDARRVLDDAEKLLEA
jgi:ADP-ribosylglycohydrolase